MQCFSTFFGSWPLCYFFTPCDPFLLFFHCIWYYNHYDYNKVLLWKNATNYHNIFTIKMHFITSNFKRQLNFTNIFNATVDFATVWPTSNIRGWVLDSANLLSCSTTLWFRASVLMWTGAEKTLSQRYIVAPKTLFRKPVQTDVDMIHAQLTRTEKMAFHENYHMLMNHSQDRKIGPVLHQEYWLMAIAKEVESRFRTHASSSSLSSEKYYWNSISIHWRWSIDAFKFLASSSVFSITHDNFSNKATFVALLHEIGFATSNKMLADSFRSWMMFVTFPFSFKSCTTFS